MIAAVMINIKPASFGDSGHHGTHFLAYQLPNGFE
jgi:hypothetical protein